MSYCAGARPIISRSDDSMGWVGRACVCRVFRVSVCVSGVYCVGVTPLWGIWVTPDATRATRASDDGRDDGRARDDGRDASTRCPRARPRASPVAVARGRRVDGEAGRRASTVVTHRNATSIRALRARWCARDVGPGVRRACEFVATVDGRARTRTRRMD